MARNRQALALALRSLGAVKHSALAPVHLASESVRGLLLLPRISIENLLPPPSTGSSSVQEASSSDQDSCFYGESRDACRTGAASLQQGSLNGTFALDGVPAHRGRVSCKVQRNSIHEEVLGAVRSSFGCRCIHASRTAAAEKSSRSGGGEAGPIEEGGQISGVPGKEGEGQPGQEAEPTVAKVDPQGFNRDSSSRFQAADARSASGPGLRQQGDESWQGSPADGAALSNLTILEQMLRELEGTKRGHGVGAAEDDQFLASLRLRLAQEYAAHNIKTQEAEGLAIKAWQYFREKGSKDDIAGAIALHVVGTCQARRGEMSSAYNILKSALAASRACRNAAPFPVPGLKRRGKKGGRPGSPMQPHSSVAQLLLQEDEEDVGAPPAASGQHSDTKHVAQSLEFSCQMMMGEIQSQQGEPREAAAHYRAAVELVEKNRALHPASMRRDAYYHLVEALSQAQQYREALAYAQRCPLGEPSESPFEPPLASGAEAGGHLAEGESRLVEAFDLIQEKRLLASIYMGLGDVERAVGMSKGVRGVLEGVGAPPLDLAAADVATAELLLVGSEREERAVLETEVEGEAPMRPAPQSGDSVGDSGEGPSGAFRRMAALQEEALELLTRALRTQQQELGPAHPVLAPTTVAAAEACVQLGKTQEAQEFATQALGLLSSEGASGADGLEHAPELMGQLATIFLGLGQQEQGLELLRRAEGLLLQEGRKGDALGMLVEYAGDLIPRAEFQAALSLLGQAEEAYSGTLHSERGWHLELLHAKGCALSSEGQHDAAIDSLEQARSLLKEAEQTAELGEMAMRVHFSRVAAYYRARKLDSALVAQEQLLSLIEEQEGRGGPLYLSENDKLEKLQAETGSS